MRLDPEHTLDAPSFSAWCDLRRDLVAMRCSPRTISGYAETLAQAGQHLAGDLLNATRRDLTAYLTWAGSPPRSAGTQSKRYRDLRRFYRWAAAEGITGANPMAGIPAPLPDHAAPAVIGAAEFTALLKTCAGRTYAALRDTAIILLLCELGSPRASEIANLLLADVDLRRDEVLIRGKGRRQRRIALGPATARAFSRYLRARAARPGAGEYPQFFLGLKGPVTRWGIAQMIARRAAAAGAGHIHPHQFRHAVTIAGRAAQVPDTAIATLNGWSSTRMCEVYGRAAAGPEALAHARRADLTAGLTRPGARP